MKGIAIAVAALAAVAPAAAQTPISVPAFDSVELRGGGRVTIRHGSSQRVSLVSGSQEMTRFTVDREGKLRIDACVRSCRNYDLVVDIVTPDLDALAIQGGGLIRSQGDFPDPRSLTVAVAGGGHIDASTIDSSVVTAAIHGGGTIRAHARDNLTVAINGGGSVVYEGDPRVTSAINGGGTVRRSARR